MLTTSMQKAINNQINDEFNAAYLYLSMSAYCETIGFQGFAKWLRKQSAEEVEHAMEISGVENNGREVIEESKTKYERYICITR